MGESDVEDSAVASIGLNIVKTTVSNAIPNMLGMMTLGFLIVCDFVIIPRIRF